MLKTKQRVKQTGEVFTPEWLASELLKKIPSNVLKDPTKTFLDPACGNGNLLIEIIKFRLESGIEPYWAIKTVYGVDIMFDNVEECKKRIVELAIGYRTKATEFYTDLLKNVVEKNIKLGNLLNSNIDDIFVRKTVNRH